jgi:hypothetical protein
MANLTAHDSNILKSLFDPEAPTTKQVNHGLSTTSLPGMTEAQFSACRLKEIQIVSTLHDGNPSQGIVQTAIGELSRLIQQSPQYASAYINRAQATRLLIPLDDLFTADRASESNQLLSDLGQGIRFAEPTAQHAQPSSHQRTVLATAYTHRGFLLLKIADMLRKEKQIYGVSQSLRSASAESVEEQASRDFAAGGENGSKEAREMAVRTNPYAKMCGAIVKEALKKENDEWKAAQTC